MLLGGAWAVRRASVHQDVLWWGLVVLPPRTTPSCGHWLGRGRPPSCSPGDSWETHFPSGSEGEGEALQPSPCPVPWEAGCRLSPRGSRSGAGGVFVLTPTAEPDVGAPAGARPRWGDLETASNRGREAGNLAGVSEATLSAGRSKPAAGAGVCLANKVPQLPHCRVYLLMLCGVSGAT